MSADIAESILVSVIIPTTRRPILLQRALRSVFDQTHQSLEVIVVIDGPNPETVAALAKIQDPRIRVIQNEQSVGAGVARNLAVTASTGEWLAFLDDDDEWLPDKLEKQLAIATGPGKYSLVSCRARVITPLATYFWPRKTYDGRGSVGDYLFDRRSLLRGDADIATSSLLISRSIFEQTKFGTSPQMEDIALLLRVEKQFGRLTMMPDILVVIYREEARETLGSSYSWKEMLDWVDGMRPFVSERAYSGFCLIYLGSQAARRHDYSAFFTLLGRSFKFGRPRPIQLLIFFLFWILPMDLRRRVRSRVLGITAAVQRPFSQLRATNG